MSMILGMLPSILMIVAPILITAIGEMICEKAGVVNTLRGPDGHPGRVPPPPPTC